MRRSGFLVGVCIALCLLAGAAQAMDVFLYIDTAPNVYGSPNYAGWEATAFADASGGTFVNMASGMYAGTASIDPTEAIVYSTGDLGKRLHWIYWIPDETVTSLAGRFQAKDAVDRDGAGLTWDDDLNEVSDTPDAGWFTPTKWKNYTNGTVSGVIGTFGDSWWAGDNDALPYSTHGSEWDEADAADVAAVADWMCNHQTYWYGEVRFRDDVSGEWETKRVTANIVPEPMSVLLGILGLSSVAGFRRFRK